MYLFHIVSDYWRLSDTKVNHSSWGSWVSIPGLTLRILNQLVSLHPLDRWIDTGLVWQLMLRFADSLPIAAADIQRVTDTTLYFKLVIYLWHAVRQRIDRRCAWVNGCTRDICATQLAQFVSCCEKLTHERYLNISCQIALRLLWVQCCNILSAFSFIISSRYGTKTSPRSYLLYSRARMGAWEIATGLRRRYTRGMIASF